MIPKITRLSMLSLISRGFSANSIKENFTRPSSRAFVFSAICWLALGISTASADVKCSCPTIDAEGEGNTSCSASESNNKCTIDYNLFAEREQRAAIMLRSKDISFLQPPPQLNSLQLGTLQYQQRVDAVILFMSVAASAQGQPVSTALAELVNRLRDNYSRDIEQAFLPVPPNRTGRIFRDTQDVVISSGCVETRVSGLWVMFKASWSPFRQAPRCGARDLQP